LALVDLAVGLAVIGIVRAVWSEIEKLQVDAKTLSHQVEFLINLFRDQARTK